MLSSPRLLVLGFLLCFLAHSVQCSFLANVTFAPNGDCDATPTSSFEVPANGECTKNPTPKIGSVRVKCTSSSVSYDEYDSKDDCSGKADVELSSTITNCISGITVNCISAGGSCFSSADRVQLSDGREISVADVRAGDRVLSLDASGRLVFDKVFRIGHFDPEAMTTFVRIELEDGHFIEMAPTHYVHAGGCCSPDELVLAKDVKAGDMLFVAPAISSSQLAMGDLSSSHLSPKRVKNVEQVQRKGAYNPHTVSSNIVVNSIAASHFTTDTTWEAGSRSWAPYWYSALNGAKTLASLVGLGDYGRQPQRV